MVLALPRPSHRGTAGVTLSANPGDILRPARHPALVDNPGTTTDRRTRPLSYVDGVVDADDLATATRLFLAFEEAVLGQPDTSADDVAALLSVTSIDRARSCFLLDGDDAVGLLVIDKDPFAQATDIEVVTLPQTGSREVSTQALRTGLAVARAHREEAGSSAWKARAGTYLADASYAEVMTENGMRPARRFYRMRIESSSSLIPAMPLELPPGVEIVGGAVDEDTRRIVHAVDRDAFRGHWGWADYPYDEWWEHMTASPSFDPDDWWLLTVDGAPAAICLLGDGRKAQNEGYVQVLGVLRDFRGRGLAQLLLRRAFVHYRALGRQATLLGVDATNPTGAVALYEKVGMSQVLVMEAYEHPLG